MIKISDDCGNDLQFILNTTPSLKWEILRESLGGPEDAMLPEILSLEEFDLCRYNLIQLAKNNKAIFSELTGSQNRCEGRARATSVSSQLSQLSVRKMFCFYRLWFVFGSWIYHIFVSQYILTNSIKLLCFHHASLLCKQNITNFNY